MRVVVFIFTQCHCRGQRKSVLIAANLGRPSVNVHNAEYSAQLAGMMAAVSTCAAERTAPEVGKTSQLRELVRRDIALRSSVLLKNDRKAARLWEEV